MDDELREMGVPGHIILKMKAEDTEQNQAIHYAFRELARVECKNDYTLALGKLLEYYETDAKVDLLWRALVSLEAEVMELKKQLAQPQEQEDAGVTF